MLLDLLLVPSCLLTNNGSMARVMIDEIKGSRGGEMVTRHWVLEFYLMTLHCLMT